MNEREYLVQQLTRTTQERDIARHALIDLLRGLTQDDEPKRRAVETAMKVVKSWCEPPGDKGPL